MQLVSQRFWPLQGILNGAMTRATCLATPLRDKLHEKLHRVTGHLANALRSIVWTELSRFFSNFFCVEVISSTLVSRKQRNTLRFATIRLKWKTGFRHRPHQTFIPDAERPIVAKSKYRNGNHALPHYNHTSLSTVHVSALDILTWSSENIQNAWY
jgi:hypothetical protein